LTTRLLYQSGGTILESSQLVLDYSLLPGNSSTSTVVPLLLVVLLLAVIEYYYYK